MLPIPVPKKHQISFSRIFNKLLLPNIINRNIAITADTARIATISIL